MPGGRAKMEQQQEKEDKKHWEKNREKRGNVKRQATGLTSEGIHVMDLAAAAICLVFWEEESILISSSPVASFLLHLPGALQRRGAGHGIGRASLGNSRSWRMPSSRVGGV